jgi:basement membrane-specific heparan sulfate proteoglycan core protein
MVRQGETVVIECEAVGVPAPLIVWRLNWGHVGVQPRTTTSVETVDQWFGQPGASKSRGILTIHNARKEDEGAYTCEAINAKGSILAVPDTIVHIIR